MNIKFEIRMSQKLTIMSQFSRKVYGLNITLFGLNIAGTITF